MKEAARREEAGTRRALFLDRDGVINVEKDYVHRVQDFEFMAGIFELCAAAVAHGFALVIVTNQAGIGRGYYTEEDFRRLMSWVTGEFRAQGIEIAGQYHCPHHPTAGIGAYRRDCVNRKPNPGMLLSAAGALGLDLARSALIGDRMTDMEAARRAGVPRRVLLRPDGVVGELGDLLIVDSLEAARTCLFPDGS